MLVEERLPPLHLCVHPVPQPAKNQGSDQFHIINIRVHDVGQYFVNIHIT
jgi:hypothetical protein